MIRQLLRLLAVIVMTVAALLAAATAAEASITGPSVKLDRTRLRADERVAVTIDGFRALNVTISVCGNEARRGSEDCNMFASEGLKLDTDGTSTLIGIPVAEPPMPCPCVIRVSSRLNDEVATTPIEIIDHPVAPVVDGPAVTDPLEVTIEAVPAPPGVFERARSSIGGPTLYRVKVTVKNRSTVPYRQISLAGTAVRGNDQLAALPLTDAGEIKPGQTWEQIVNTEVPGPSLGSIEWRVTVSGAGPTVSATDTTRQRPLLLIVLVGLLIIDVFVLAIRYMMRRRSRREARRAAAALAQAAASAEHAGKPEFATSAA
ncbi:MAG: hypothetical protein ABMA25_28775 [Ilumatobacteraceae bacterium]